ncbi:Helix-turn-helix domain-containing protein [Lihuaxuella thermophila]|uniref:Helix-turn-helix domain-containing protein n=2 Tax=Lihuaxuella thermophila TaxID=1173111 RepID=A0A1H8DL72_9BACL|nr:Helix-turn-helix domain-containing protein [Lihuaxuella thermophila]
MFKILIADDEAVERQALKMLISSRVIDAEVVGEAENGRRAIELAKELKPDLIMMDIKMPGIDGVEAVKEIKQLHPQTKFIMVSAFDTFEYARQVMQQGVKEYLLKPSRKSEIIRAVERTLAEMKREREEKEEQDSLRKKLQQALGLIQSGLVPREPASTDPPVFLCDDPKVQSMMNKAKQFIDDHYMKGVSLEDVAGHVGLSPYYFSKLFKEWFQVTFTDYLTGIRIEKAKQMILHSDCSLKEICFNVGYRDPNYFSRVFKKMTGFSPSEYRKAFFPRMDNRMG